MRKKLIIIGGDSYIAGNFIAGFSDNFYLKIFSRKSTRHKNETVVDNFFDIHDSHYKNCYGLINFAAIVHQQNVKDKNLYQLINTNLPIHLAQKAKKNNIRHFIQMSTISVYGSANYITEYSPEIPYNGYGISKLNADNELKGYSDSNFIISIIRPPMVYGGGNCPGNMQNLLRTALRGIPLPFKNVNSTRDFINVKNLVRFINIIIENQLGGVLLPTDQNGVSTEDILRIANKYSLKKIRLFKMPMPLRFLIRRINPELYSKLFGSLIIKSNIKQSIYKPTLSVENGIKEIISYLEVNN